MKIEVFKNFQYIGIIDEFVDATVERTYRNTAEFSINFNSFDYINILEIDNILLINDEPYIIKEISQYKNLDGELRIDIKGFSPVYFLEDRILLKPFKIKQGEFYEDIIYNLIEENLINPTESSRKINFIKNRQKKTLQPKALTNFEMKAITVKEAITRLAGYSGLGYKFNFKDDFLEFEVYEGRVLTDRVIFSEEYGNIADTNIKNSTIDQKNIAYSFDEFGNIEKKVIYRNIEREGIDRKEVIIDDEDGSNINEVLKTSNDTLKINTLAIDTEQSKYKTNWDIGDTVIFENKFFKFEVEKPVMSIKEFYTNILEIEINFAERSITWQTK
jgi:hypothetical protein